MESDFAIHLHQMMAENMWGVYLCLLIAPFVQEDAAVIGAASLSLATMGNTALLFLFVALGLTGSDLWKYWLGRAARTQAWAKKFAAKPSVAKAETLVREKLGATLMTVRFVPGTRIPAYVASGYFEASWLRFAFWIVVSAVIYIAIAFALFHTVGAVAGEAAKLWLPVIAISALLGYLLMRWIRTKQQRPEGGTR
jgi:membrane protein DedA with SNARE-associated domain